MKDEEIIKGNRTIAEFMEAGYWQIWKKGGYKPHWVDKYKSKEGAQEIIDISVNQAMEKYLKGNYEPKYISAPYHKDWNLLMPVVKKLNEWRDTCDIDGDKLLPCELMFVLLKETLANVDIETSWKQVVKIINWYNQNKAV